LIGTTKIGLGIMGVHVDREPKSVGRLPLIFCHDSPPSSVRITSQCFCMKSVCGRDGCMAMR
jgi:hypothetical protein